MQVIVPRIPEGPRSDCAVAGTLDLLGDRWSLLVIRDLLGDRALRYGDFLEAPEGIPTNTLADRLKRLEAHGLIERRRYQAHPPRDEYRLTAKGRSLGPVLDAIANWGVANLPGTRRLHPTAG